MTSAFASLLRGRSPISPLDAARAALGALLAIALTGVLARLAVDHHWRGAPLLIPPMGASAVLLFSIPASPLAQPRAVLGGNVVSALVGVACAAFIPHPLLAAAAAVGGAILAMSLLGCLHPPGGAVALGAALSGGVGFAYVLAPVALCSLLMVGAAILYGRVSRRPYPHRVAAPPSPHRTHDAPPASRVGYTPADLDKALAQYGDLLDVSRDDLDALFRQVEMQAHDRIHARITCGEVMSRDVLTVDVHQSASSALNFLQQHDLRTAPVVDGNRKVYGLVRRAELVAGRGLLVEAVLDPFAHRVRPAAPIQALFPLLSSGRVHEALVVDEDRVLLGIITQTDLLAVLYRAHIVEAVFSP